MTTIVNSPTPSNGDGMGAIVAIFSIIVIGFLFVYFGIPALRNMGTPQNSVPAPVINVPDEVDINVQQTP